MRCGRSVSQLGTPNIRGCLGEGRGERGCLGEGRGEGCLVEGTKEGCLGEGRGEGMLR